MYATMLVRMTTRCGDRLRALVLIGALSLPIPGCSRLSEPAVEKLPERQRLADYRLTTFSGQRDGDRLVARIVFSGPRGTLEMELHFRVGVPTHLDTGQYRWQRGGDTLRGDVAERAVTFLGGQSDRPGLGGVFDLLSSQGTAVLRVTVPKAPLERLDPRKMTPLPR